MPNEQGNGRANRRAQRQPDGRDGRPLDAEFPTPEDLGIEVASPEGSPDAGSRRKGRAADRPTPLLGPRLVAAGVDTIIIGLRGSISEQAAAGLEAAKRKAQEDKKRQGPFLMLGPWSCEVQPFGVAYATYVCTGADGNVYVQPDPYGAAPNVMVQPRAVTLWEHGWKTAVAQAMDAAGAVLENAETAESWVSRLDIAVDVAGWEPRGTELTDGRWVSRARKRTQFKTTAPATTANDAEYVRGRTHTGFWLGQGGALMARVYAKRAEIAFSGKVWMERIWERAELPPAPDEPVERIEVQWRRDALRVWRVVDPSTGELRPPRTAFELLDCIPELWSYAVGSSSDRGWVELRVPDGGNVTRWKLDPAWGLVQDVPWHELEPERIPGLRTEEQEYRADRLAAQVAGCLVSWSAVHREDATDVRDAIGAMESEVEAAVNRQGGWPERIDRRRKELGK